MAELRLPNHLEAWVEQVTGRQLVSAVRRPGGGRKEAWLLQVRDGGGPPKPLFLRYDRSDPAVTGDPWTIHREGAVYLALQDTDVPVPSLIAVHPEDQAMLSVCVEGENWFSRIKEPDVQLAVAREFMTHLAALHRIDVDKLDLPGFPPATAVPDLVRYELDELEAVLTFRGGPVDPALRFSLDWLSSHVPDYEGPAVLVQGDTGPGNFMYLDGRITAIVDWELAHLGDPMDDLAWLSLRATQEPFTHLPDRIAEYVELSGHELDVERVHFYQVLAEAKLQVMGHGRIVAAADDGGGGTDVGTRMVYGVLHQRLWMEALGTVLRKRFDPPTLPPLPQPTEVDRLYDTLLDQLREVVVPRIDDAFAANRTKGLARLLKYLAQVSRRGGSFGDQELDEIGRAIGWRPSSVDEGRAALVAAVHESRLAATDYLPLLANRIHRQNELLRPASGVLADRHWPPLT